MRCKKFKGDTNDEIQMTEEPKNIRILRKYQNNWAKNNSQLLMGKGGSTMALKTDLLSIKQKKLVEEE